MVSVNTAEMPPSLPGFEAINRFWDKRRHVWVAKILPGEFYVSRQDEYIATTLGSCVSACLWDDRFGIGGMNHFMLPLTDRAAHEVTWGNLPSDATRYGNYAMEHMINELLKNGGARKHLRAKVFGGARVLRQCSDVGEKNVAFVLEYLRLEKIPIVSYDLQEQYARKVLFDPRTGRAFMKPIRVVHNNTILEREKSYQNSLVREPVEGDIELF